MKQISKAVLAVMEEVGYIQKEQKKGVSFRIKSERAVIQAIRPALLKHKLIMVPWSIDDVRLEQNTILSSQKKEIIQSHVVATFTYRFIHAPSGEHLDAVVLGSGESRGDDKAPYMANTGSKKYAILNFFLLEAGDDPDYTPRNKDGDPTQVEDEPEDNLPEDEEEIEQKHIDELEKQIQKAEALGIEISSVDYTSMKVGQWRKAWSMIMDTIEAHEKQNEPEVDEDDIPF